MCDVERGRIGNRSSLIDKVPASPVDAIVSFEIIRGRPSIILLIRRALLLRWYLELSDVCILSLFLLLLRLVFCRVVDGRDDVSEPLSSKLPDNMYIYIYCNISKHYRLIWVYHALGFVS